MGLTHGNKNIIIYDNNHNEVTIADDESVSSNLQSGFICLGQNSNVIRFIKSDYIGNIITANPNLLFSGPIEGSNLNANQWTKTATQTVTQSNGVILLNATGSKLTSLFSSLVSTKWYPIINNTVLVCSFFAKPRFNDNGRIEIGLASNLTPFDGTSISLNPGAYFRITGGGVVTLVISIESDNTTVASNTIISNNYYKFIVALSGNGAQFIVEDSSGIPVIDQFVPIPTTSFNESLITHLRSQAHTYYIGTSVDLGITQLSISSNQVFLLGSQFNKSWGEHYSGINRSSAYNPVTNTVTMQAASTAPTQSTPVVGSSVYSTLGGEFWLNAIATTETPVGVFSYTVSTGYTLHITDIWMPAPIVTTAMGATVHHHQWWIFIKNAATGAAPNVAGGFRYCLGTFTAAASAVVGTMFNGSTINLNFGTPMVIPKAATITVAIKTLSGAATGAYRGCINFNGYFE